MTTYGRNFDFLQSPLPQHRLGRFKTGSAVLRQGQPVKATGIRDTGDLRRPVTAAVTADAPLIGAMGLLVFEDPWTAFTGVDPVLVSPSDLDTVPALSPAQVVHGTEVRIQLVNTSTHVFQNNRTYTGFTIITVTSLAIDDLLSPGTGVAGTPLWIEATTPANAWARVTGIDSATDAVTGAVSTYVEAQLLF